MRAQALITAVSATILTAATPAAGLAQSPDRLLPDLILADISIAGTPRIGTCNTALISVYNGGNGSVSDAELLVRAQSGTWRRDINVTTGSIGSGSTKQVAVRDLRLESRLAVGAVVDPNDRIVEHSNHNNDAVDNFSSSSYCTTFSVGDVSVSEGGTATFTVLRSGARPLETQSITFTTIDGSALGGTACSTRGSGPDYVKASGTLRFSRFERGETVSIQTCNDRALEGSETFHLFLSSPPFGSTFTDGRATATITR